MHTHISSLSRDHGDTMHENRLEIIPFVRDHGRDRRLSLRSLLSSPTAAAVNRIKTRTTSRFEGSKVFDFHSETSFMSNVILENERSGCTATQLVINTLLAASSGEAHKHLIGGISRDSVCHYRVSSLTLSIELNVFKRKRFPITTSSLSILKTDLIEK